MQEFNENALVAKESTHHSSEVEEQYLKAHRDIKPPTTDKLNKNSVEQTSYRVDVSKNKKAPRAGPFYKLHHPLHFTEPKALLPEEEAVEVEGVAEEAQELPPVHPKEQALHSLEQEQKVMAQALNLASK